MKWLIMSDNHGNWAKVNEIIEAYQNATEVIIHCGDSEFPADDPIWEKVTVVVAGNMDFDPQYLKLRTLETPKGKVLVVHGHQHGVNYGNDELVSLARSLDAKYVFHGHTHRLYAEKKEGILFVNPGSLNHSRGAVNEKTFAIVSFDDSKNEGVVEFYTDHNQKLNALTYTFSL